MDNDSRWQRLINDGELPPPLRPTQAVYASAALPQPDAARRLASTAPRSGRHLRIDLPPQERPADARRAALEDACEYMEPRRCLLMILDESGCMLWRCGDAKTQELLQPLGFAPALTGPRADRHQRPGAGGGGRPPGAGERRGARAPGAARLVVLRHAGLRQQRPPTRLDRARLPAGRLRRRRSVADAGHRPRNRQFAERRRPAGGINRHLNQLYGLLDGVDDGVMAQDHRGYLQYINQRAAGLLKLDEQQSGANRWRSC